MYDALKTLHVIGVVVLLGNVTITAFWKVFSDRTRDPAVIAHAQRGVTVSDWIFTVGGIVMILVGGYGAAFARNLPIFELSWLVIGQILFAVSGIIWLAVLVPIQWRQARAARQFAGSGAVPDAYWRDGRRWLVWGIIATVPLVAAIHVMIAKP